jgi:hypothetical protein
MVSSKIEKAKYGPGMVEIFFGVLLSLLLGAVVAVVYLALQPVQVGAPDPKTGPVGTVSFVQGTQDLDRGKQWLRKKQLFTEGTSVEVNEDELNAWITAGTAPEPTKPADAKKPGPAAPAKPGAPAPGAAPAKPGAPDEPAAGLIEFGTPNFRIANGVFQMGSEGQLNLDMLGVKRPIVLQAAGRFARIEGKLTFVPDQFYIGCCPLHKLPWVGGFILEHVLANENIPEDIAAAWKKVSSVVIDGNVLKLTMP